VEKVSLEAVSKTVSVGAEVTTGGSMVADCSRDGFPASEKLDLSR